MEREEKVGRRREKTRGFFPRQRTHFPRPASSLLLALLPWRPLGHTTIPRGAGHGRGKQDLADLQAAGGLPPSHCFWKAVNVETAMAALEQLLGADFGVSSQLN